MGRKYIIELEKPEMFDERKYYQCSQMPWWSVSENIVENLTPYTEPDLEQVRKEAYEDGYKTAKVQCNIQAEKDLREVGERHYQKGLSDAWEAARKIVDLWRDIPNDELMKIFDVRGNWGESVLSLIMRCLPPSEAIEKIRQYERRQEEIQVGDEVNWMGDKYVVTYVRCEAKKADLISCKFGSACENVAFSALVKTGRHFPEIAEVLAKMREESNG